jgi:hypothetical protein
MVLTTVRFSKQGTHNGAFRSLHREWNAVMLS